jgi:hypothetical protein
MVTFSGAHEKPKASPSTKKFGKHFMDCVRQSKSYCKTHKKIGETNAECAQGLCHYHMRYGKCAIGGHIGSSFDRNKRSGPGKAYLNRLKKREKKKG